MSLDYSFLFIASGSLTARDLLTQNDSYVVLQVGTITTTYDFVLGSTCTFDANGTVIGDLENDGTIIVGGLTPWVFSRWPATTRSRGC
jgi:hypothetical protein